jgi:hypothetical protein
MRKTILAGAAFAALVTAGAQAQTSMGALDQGLAQMRIDELEDMTVIGQDGQEIGELDEVTRGPDGVYAVIEAEDRELVVPLGHLAVEGGDRLVLRGMDAADARNLPDMDTSALAEIEDDDMTVGEAMAVR